MARSQAMADVEWPTVAGFIEPAGSDVDLRELRSAILFADAGILDLDHAIGHVAEAERRPLNGSPATWIRCKVRPKDARDFANARSASIVRQVTGRGQMSLLDVAKTCPISGVCLNPRPPSNRRGLEMER